MSLVSRLRHATLVSGDVVVDRREVNRRIGTCCAWLTSQGVRSGDRVAIDIQGGISFAVAFMACLRSGITVAPIDAQLKEDERHAVVDDLQPKLIIRDADSARPLGELHQARSAGEGASQGDHPSLILYTSGSTGRPKGAVLSSAALEFAIDSWTSAVMGLTQDDVLLQVLPMAHSYGLCAGLLAPMLAGCRVVMLERFSPETVLQRIQEQQVTVFPGVATMFSRLLTHTDCTPQTFGSLRMVLSGAAPCTDDLCTEWSTRTGTKISRGYGMTELFRPISYLWDDATDEPGVVGRPVPGVHVKVVDGELLIKSPAAMDGYLNAPEETRAVLRDGWFWTGDLATVDDRGGVRILGRKRERILRGGYSVFPSEVEAVLLAHPAVHEAVVLGQPHPELGEEVTAFVVLRADRKASPDELVEHCRERLAGFKYPRQVILLAQLPRSSAGKVLKAQLAAGAAS
jgi:long-chain acyl-CoA synthetase